MANVFIEASTMTAIGDAIRAKTGGMAQIYPKDMPAQIASITTGGGDSDLVRYVTFLDEDGTQLFKMPVLVGDDCKDPVSHGDISTPTKESTNTQVFTYSGWTSTVGGTADSGILKAVTEDKTVYAAYTASVRYYTVTFYDDDNVTVLNTEQIAYGGSSSYEPEKTGYIFVEWNPSPTNVVADMDCYATWQEGASFAAATWAEVIYACQNNLVPAAWKVGDSKEMVVGDYTYTIDIIGKGHDTYTDGGNAPLTFQLHDLYATKYAMNDSKTLIGYGATLMHNTHLPSIKAIMPTEVQAAIKAVDKKSVKTTNDTTIETVSCELFLLSQIEIFGDGNSEGSQYEYYRNGGSKIKYLSGAESSWWLRAPFVNTTNPNAFSAVTNRGTYNGYSMVAPLGVSFAFCF